MMLMVRKVAEQLWHDDVGDDAHADDADADDADDADDDDADDDDMMMMMLM